MNKEGDIDNLDRSNFEDIDIDEEMDISQSNYSLNKEIFSKRKDLEVEALCNRILKGKLILRPYFQRRHVWDTKKSSSLIESSLLNMPLPSIYISEEKDGREYVIDGQQRLTAFFSFINGRFPDDPNGREFKLVGLEAFPEFEGKSFKELDPIQQDRIMGCMINTIVIDKDTDPDLKFLMFKKLNTGVVSLNDQELRNCMYAGEYSELLKELSEDKDFMYLFRLEEPDVRMRDVELVLRFASFFHFTYLKYKGSMKRFFNDDMRNFQHISEEDRIKLKATFKNSVQIIRSMFGEHAFKRFRRGDEKNPNGRWEPIKLNHSLYDILMYSFANADKNKVYHNLDTIREALIDLMANDKEFVIAITDSTSSTQAVMKRFDKWRMVLNGIIGVSQKEHRCFSLKLKEELYKNNPTCSICGQRIHDIDDAAVDHIEQYWMGGRTIPENARLAHRYCNAARSKNDLTLKPTVTATLAPTATPTLAPTATPTLAPTATPNQAYISLVDIDNVIQSEIQEGIGREQYDADRERLDMLIRNSSHIGSGKERSYMLPNGTAVMLDYSKWYPRYNPPRHWHGIVKSKFDEYNRKYNRFCVVLDCQYFGIYMIPGNVFSEWFRNFNLTNNKTTWNFRIIHEGTIAVIYGKENINEDFKKDISGYRYRIGMFE